MITVERLADVLAERDRLREINAELLAALRGLQAYESLPNPPGSKGEEVHAAAKKAGLAAVDETTGETLIAHGLRDALAIFAEEIQSAERERCANICEDEHVGQRIDDDDLCREDLAYNRALMDAVLSIHGDAL